MKKRYWALGLIALELISLPAAAQIIDKVRFEIPQMAVHSELPHTPGLTRMFVTSNAPFAITAKNGITEFEVTVSREGRVGQQAYGMNAQLPGPAEGCAATTHATDSIIYRAERKTARARGPVASQAVFVEIRYPSELSPEFDVLTQREAEALPAANACTAAEA